MYFSNIINKVARAKPDISSNIDVDILKKTIESYFDLPIIMKDRYSGTHHFVYSFRFYDRNQEYIAKISYASKSQIHIEYQIINLLRQKKIVDIEFIHLVQNSQMNDILICNKAKGQQFRNIEINTSIQYYNKLRNIAEKIKELHSINVISDGYGVIQFMVGETLKANNYSWFEFLYSTIDEEMEFLKTIIKPEQYDEIEGYIISYHPKIKKRIFRSSVLHGDLSSKNIFVAENNISLIDFEDVIIGDPLFDIANFLSFYKMNNYFNFFVKCYDSEITKESEEIILFYYLRIMIAKFILTSKVNEGNQPIESLNKISFVLNNLKSYN